MTQSDRDKCGRCDHMQRTHSIDGYHPCNATRCRCTAWVEPRDLRHWAALTPGSDDD